MNTIFLDIDGVLNSSSSVMAAIGPGADDPSVQKLMVLVGELPYGVKMAIEHVDPVAVGLLNRLIAETNSRLVLISTHRLHFRNLAPLGSDLHVIYQRAYMAALRINVPEEFYVTKQFNSIRGEEVKEWLDEHQTANYAILDDGTDFYGYQNHVRVNAKHGFTFDDYTKALKYLGVTPSELILPYEAR